MTDEACSSSAGAAVRRTMVVLFDVFKFSGASGIWCQIHGGLRNV